MMCRPRKSVAFEEKEYYSMGLHNKLQNIKS